MSGLMEHRGYFGSVEISEPDGVLHGRLEFIRDVVTYEADDARGLRAAFEEAVADYLEMCAAEGRPPDTPLKGSFNVRPGRDLHRRAALFALKQHLNLNAVVVEALRSYLDRNERPA